MSLDMYGKNTASLVIRIYEYSLGEYKILKTLSL